MLTAEQIFPVLIAFTHFDLMVINSGVSVSQNRQCSWRLDVLLVCLNIDEMWNSVYIC